MRKIQKEILQYKRKFPDEAEKADKFLRLIAGHEEYWHRKCFPGHVTAGAWVMDPKRERTMLVHHKGMNKWFQPGGHCDEDESAKGTALREVYEETGLRGTILWRFPLDLAIHSIPPLPDEPSHEHYDMNYPMVANGTKYRKSKESHRIAWVHLDDAPSYIRGDEPMQRMLKKWRTLF